MLESGFELCNRAQLIEAFENVDHSGPERGQWGEMVSGFSLRDEAIIEFEPGEYVGNIDLEDVDPTQLGEAL
ncbi:MAG: hypothetical protein U0524_02750 [Candidatus Saccharimonadales bacterium]